MKATLTDAVKKYGKFIMYCGALFLLVFGAAKAFASVYSDWATVLVLDEPTEHVALENAMLTNSALVDSDDTGKEINFEVRAVSQSRFVLSFNNTSDNAIFIKIYDIIGNLVAKEKVTQKGLYQKEYTLLNTRNEFYIIEVGNAQAINTKKLFLS